MPYCNKVRHFSSSTLAKNRYYITRKFHLQMLNISQVIVFEIWKIGAVKHPRKWLNICLAYINYLNEKQCNKTIKRQKKPMKGRYPNKVYSLLNFSVYKYFFV